MKAQTFLSAAVIAMSITGLAHAAPNLVVNGSFEEGGGSFDGWQTEFGDVYTVIQGDGGTGRHFGEASDGIWSAYMGAFASSGGGSISQVLPTTGGQDYLLSFDLANSNRGEPALNYFNVSIDGVQRMALENLPDRDYVRETFHFVASGTSSRLTILASNDPWYLQLDHVVVAAVPEPATAPMALVALSSLGWALMRRRRR